MGQYRSKHHRSGHLQSQVRIPSALLAGWLAGLWLAGWVWNIDFDTGWLPRALGSSGMPPRPQNHQKVFWEPYGPLRAVANTFNNPMQRLTKCTLPHAVYANNLKISSCFFFLVYPLDHARAGETQYIGNATIGHCSK